MMTFPLLSVLLVSFAHADDPTPIRGGLASVASEDARTDGNLVAWGQLQTWATLMDQDSQEQAEPASYGDPEADPGFSLARARIGLSGLLPLGAAGKRAQISYDLSLGINSPYDAVVANPETDVQIVDATTTATVALGRHPASLGVGMQRVPFSREALISSTDLLFQERGPATEWLTPGRDPGAVLGQAIRFTDEQDGPQLALRGGLFNGNGSALGDTDPGLLAVGRFEFAMGETYRTWSPDGEPAVGLGGSIAANPELATGNQLMNVDFLGRVWYLTAMAQLTTSTVSPLETTIVSPEVPAETKRRGILGQLSGFIPIEGAHGIEIGTRFASYDDSQAFEDNGDVWLLHSGVTWREPLPFLDLGAGFIHRHEPAGPAIANDSFRIWTQVRPSVKVAGS